MEMILNNILNKMAQAQITKQEFKQGAPPQLTLKEEKEERLRRVKKCECGYDPHRSNVDYDRYSRCHVKTPLSNHITFTSVNFMTEYDDPSLLYYELTDAFRPCRHWATILEIRHDISFLRPGIIGLNQFGEEQAVHFYHDNDKKPKTFSWSDLKPGNTLAILYPEKKVFLDGTEGIREEDLNSCYIFLAPIKYIQEEAKNLLYCADSKTRNEAEKCFTCGLASITLSQCGDCKLAKYCSRECQVEAWRSHHKKLCKQTETLLRFACIQRYNFREYFSFDNDLPLYKPEPVSKNSKRNNRRKNIASVSSSNYSSNE